MSRIQAFAAHELENLYSDHHGWLRGWLRQRVGCSETAADLAQDTFVRILLKECIPQPDSPRAYLSTVARGLMFNHWRRRALEQAYLEMLASEPEPLAPSPEEQHLVVDTLMHLAEVLDGLPRRDKHIFLLARLDGMKYRAIAERLGINVNQVQKAMIRSMRQCYRVFYDG